MPVAKSNWEKALLDLKAAEVKTELEREIYGSQAEGAEAIYEQLQADIPITKERHSDELRMLEIAHKRQMVHLDNHKHDLLWFTIRAPMSGLSVMQQVFRSGEAGQIQEGDQVKPGRQIMKIVDLSNMHVEAAVNQAGNTEFRVGQRACAGLEAFPGAEFAGSVCAVGALAVLPGRGESYYPCAGTIRIAIERRDPCSVLGASAWAEIELERQDDALLIPLQAVHREKDQDVVYVRGGDGLEG